jgi:hypothetical protein
VAQAGGKRPAALLNMTILRNLQAHVPPWRLLPLLPGKQALLIHFLWPRYKPVNGWDHDTTKLRIKVRKGEKNSVKQGNGSLSQATFVPSADQAEATKVQGSVFTESERGVH